MKKLHLTLLVLWAAVQVAAASSVTLKWNANPAKENVTGYSLYYGTEPGYYTFSVDVGQVTTKTIAGLTPGQDYYFALKAYNGPFPSPISAEVKYTPDSFTVGLGNASGQMSTKGGPVTFTVNISRTGFDGAVSCNVSGLPPGIMPSFSTNPVTTRSTLTLKGCEFVPAGEYPFTVVGFGCGIAPLTQTVTGTLNKKATLNKK